MQLVIPRKASMLSSMGILSWYRSAFLQSQPRRSGELLAAAESGDAEAQVGLGLKLSKGADSARDPDQAARWFRQAALQGHALAQFNLGLMLASGDGVPQDIPEGLTWTRKAAEGGDAAAQFSLGSRCHRSSVSRQDGDCAESRIEAYKWFFLAAAQGYKGSAAACEQVTLKMTRDEVVHGNERVTTFRVRKPSEASIPFDRIVE
jgi:TPR repeat protein